jgi:predicted SprT family Zn-dependent metalloprotease
MFIVNIRNDEFKIKKYNDEILNNIEINFENNELKYIVDMMNFVYFNNLFNLNNFNFSYSSKLKKSGGNYSYKSNTHTIKISKSILENTFNNNEKFYKINGIYCHNIKECILNILQHEFVHFLIHSHGIIETHGHFFKKWSKNIFGHTEFKHNLLIGCYSNVIEKLKNFKIGSVVYINDMICKITKIENNYLLCEDEYGNKIKSSISSAKLCDEKYNKKTSNFKIGDEIIMYINGKEEVGKLLDIKRVNYIVKIYNRNNKIFSVKKFTVRGLRYIN